MKSKFFLPIIFVSALFVVTGVVLHKNRNVVLSSNNGPKSTQPEPLTVLTGFPDIDTSQLSPTQQNLVTLLKEEYKAQPQGTKYAQGVSEPWCADFVSWIYKKAGKPLVNPNSNSWRIPGTITLRDYFKSKHQLKLAASNYQPKVGDVMLYENPSPFGNHTNIVIKNDNGKITTIGGNEYGTIRIVEHTTPDKDGFIGYGVF